MKLTIAIPTYNRAKRLKKALSDLLNEIKLSKNQAKLSVYVSNNGSSDETPAIIEEAEHLFCASNVEFTSRNAESNQGFDSNVITCYRESPGDYVWFLSDDDNLTPGSIDMVFSDINLFQPSLIYYNFDQAPYNQANPYVTTLEFFEQVTRENIIVMDKIVKWPKLSSLIIKKCPAGLQVPDLRSGFAHITLALQVALSNGKVVHSPFFIAFPDLDYLDHIDFVPFIGNNMNDCIRWTLAQNDRESLWDLLEFPHADPLTSSLHTLRAYYRGQYTLTLPLKNELWSVCRREISQNWRNKIRDQQLITEATGFLATLIRYFFNAIVLRNKIGKIRQLPCVK